MNFLAALQKSGADLGGTEGALRVLVEEMHLAPSAIGRRFGVEGREVWFWLNAFGIACDNAEPRIFAGARRRRCATLADYFRKRWTRGFQAMAEELGVSRATVEIYHRHFVAGTAQAKGR